MAGGDIHSAALIADDLGALGLQVRVVSMSNREGRQAKDNEQVDMVLSLGGTALLGTEPYVMAMYTAHLQRTQGDEDAATETMRLFGEKSTEERARRYAQVEEDLMAMAWSIPLGRPSELGAPGLSVAFAPSMAHKFEGPDRSWAAPLDWATLTVHPVD